MSDFDQFLSQTPSEPAPAPEPVPEAPVAVEATPDPQATQGEIGAPPAPELPPRGDDGRFQKREHVVPLEALLSERERRQAAEREAQELRAKTQPVPDVWENPAAFVEGKVKEVESRLLTEADKRAEVRARELFLSYTEGEARGRYTDYDQMREVFSQEVQRNPVLISQLASAPNPAEFIYQQGRIARELQQVGGNLSAYRQRIEAEVRAKLEAEYAAKPQRTAAVPQSLNSEPSRGAGIQGAVWNGPTPLEDILPTRRS